MNKLVSEEESARKAYEEFQARIALQQQLVQMRKAEHMTQSDVAHAAGLSQQAVSRIEKGVRIVTDYELFVIARILKVSPLWLIGWE